ncbi:gpORF158 [Staphylococcus phage A5W]|uniref:GpORF158 n=1 Tax=Staphylococcus phage A5W TaxID=516541 RepID=D3G7R8_9CAUD|nr:gpORF158 [Staphylococcus phage A5W]ACB89151.1 gpORF158 [Staphylococcus phage A5W]
MNEWYALCYYNKIGKKKIPRQIKAHRDVSVLEDLKDRLEEQNLKEEYKIKTTKEFDKER